VRVCICAIPIRDFHSFDVMPYDEWWKDHGAKVGSIVERTTFSGRDETSMEGGIMAVPWISGYGVMILLGGSVLILFACVHKMRGFCGLLILACAYLGAVDSLVLRIEGARMQDADSLSARFAVVNVARAGLHPVSASDSLLDVAASDADPEVRACALRCLNRFMLREAMRSNKVHVTSTLNTLTSDADPGVVHAAEALLRRLSDEG
jgi:hypothetical protein